MTILQDAALSFSIAPSTLTDANSALGEQLQAIGDVSGSGYRIVESPSGAISTAPPPFFNSFVLGVWNQAYAVGHGRNYDGQSVLGTSAYGSQGGTVVLYRPDGVA